MDNILVNYDRSQSAIFEMYGIHVTRAVKKADLNLHTHDFDETFIIVAGSARHVIGNYSYQINRGDVYVIKKGVAHGFFEVDNLEIVDLMYYPDLFSVIDMQLYSLLLPLFIVEPDIRTYNYYPYVLSLTESEVDYVATSAAFIVQELLKRTPDNNNVAIRYCLLSLFAYLSVKYAANDNEPQVTQILSKAIQYIHENMAKRIKISDISSHLFISTRHLNRLFRKYYGCTPGDYLHDIRFKHAITLLSKNHMKVQEVSALCGFSDPSYFSRSFKETYGITPNKVAKK